MRIHFSEFAFDPEARELRRAGAGVPLSPRAFQLLARLLQARPRALSKEELLEALWPGTFVAEGSLTALVSELRHALGDSDRAGLVRTVHGFGYAFHGEARDEGSQGASRFAFRWAGHDLPLSEGDNVLGRDAIPDATVSRRHARVVVRGAEVLAEDLGSKNGTFLGGARLAGPTPLAPGALLKVGSVVLQLLDRSGEGATRTSRE